MGMELRLARVRAGMTQKQLETFFEGHPTRPTLQNVEQGKHEPEARTVRVVEEFIRMTPEAVELRARTLGIKPRKKGKGNGT